MDPEPDRKPRMDTDIELELRSDKRGIDQEKPHAAPVETLLKIEGAIEREAGKAWSYIRHITLELDTVVVHNLPVRHYDNDDDKATPKSPSQRLSRRLSKNIAKKKKEWAPSWFMKFASKVDKAFTLPRHFHIHSMAKHAHRRHDKVHSFKQFFHKHDAAIKMFDNIAKFEESPVRFIWWISLIQVLIFAIAMGKNGATPWGVGTYNTTHTINYFNNHNITQQLTYSKNIWYGPSTQTIVSYGAKYTPCMRQDPIFTDAVAAIVKLEESQGCCADSMKNCGRMTESTCLWAKGKWYSGDCTSKLGTKCVEVTLHPCCYYLSDGCVVTSEAHCSILPGPTKYHADKEACSEVSCEANACGMGWLGGSKPNQFWRFFTPVFMHAGVVHLVSNLIAQIAIGGDVESLAGFWATAFMYLLSGIGGNIVAAVFDPTQISAGCSSSLYGLVGVQTVDLLMSWQLVDHKAFQAARLIICLVLVLGVGTLPWLDNFAHVGGFFVGIVSGMAVLPYATFSRRDKLIKWFITRQARVLLVASFVALLAVFYLVKNPHFCTWCKYIDCIPYTEHLCDSV
eukprot:c10043_g1_i1.p1 GENE.c10043_g1_i1~~c10043_g1_i1.p1  ORF type:complete len:577 (-),score=137.60 c10043_g1_i1:92-1795(-)